MTIYITGDTHIPIDIKKLTSKKFPEGTKLTKNDYVIICGDFGLIWTKEDAEERHWTKWLNEKPWTTLFVDGNHENHIRLQQLPKLQMFNGTVGKVSDSIFHLRRGEIYEIEGMKFFTMGGAQSHDKENRTIDITWWKEEEPNHQEINYAIDNLEKHQWNVDYVITHTIPAIFLKMCLISHNENDSTIKFLDHVLNNLTYKKWYCGHWHINEDHGKFEILYNKVKKIDLFTDI